MCACVHMPTGVFVHKYLYVSGEYVAFESKRNSSSAGEGRSHASDKA